MSALSTIIPAFGSLAAASHYSITDLGTLGGLESGATGINNRGQVVGSSSIAISPLNKNDTEELHAFLYSNGRMIDLGTLGGPSSIANGINNKGQVVGNSQTSCTYHAFLYSDGQMKDIGTLGGEFAFANAINDAGQVVGYSGQEGRHAFIYSQGKMTDLGTLGGKTSAALGINNQGQVVGISETANGQMHAFLYNGEAESIAAAAGNCSRSRSQSSSKATMLYATRRMTDLGTLDGEASRTTATNSKEQAIGSVATRINNQGQVVGFSQTASKQMHAFLYSQGKMTDLGTLGGKESMAYGINDRGQVVGTSMTASGKMHAFVWQDGAMTDLNELNTASPGMVLNEATGINDAGQIVGVCITQNKNHHAFLMTPRSQQ